MNDLTADVPLVSVGMPVHNMERTIRAALESVLAQSYRNLEVVVYDNGSTDGTADVVSEVARGDDRVRLERGETNSGLSRSFNSAFELTSGTYFLWVAADDSIGANYVSSAVARLESDTAVMLCAPAVTAYLEGRPDPVYEVHISGFGPGVSRFDRLRRSNGGLPMVVMYGVFRSSFLATVCLLKLSHMADVAFMQEVAVRGPIVEEEEQRHHYSMARLWRTTRDEHRLFTGREVVGPVVMPFLPLLMDRVQRMWSLELGTATRIGYVLVVVSAECRRLAIRAAWRCYRSLVGSVRASSVGEWVYWRWMHVPGVEVRDMEAFIERVVYPTMGLPSKA